MEHWRHAFEEVVKATAPIALVIVILQVALLERDPARIAVVVLGSIMAMAGLVLFLTGARVGILAFGERLGNTMPQFGSVTLLVLFGVLLGFAITVAEPDVRVLSSQIQAASPGLFPGGSLIYGIAIGVALFVGLSLVRSVLGASLVTFLVPGYLLLFLLTALTPPEYLAIAFDSGGVTTGPLTVPFIIAFNVGVASVLGRRDGVSDSFGIVALASIGPVATLMLLGMILGGRG